MNLKRNLSVFSLAAAFMLSGAATASAAPDLVVSSLSGPASVELGEPFLANITLTNQGADGVDSVAIVRYSVFVSTDTTLDSGDVCAGYGGVDRSTLTAGSSYATSLMLLLNASNVPADTYYLIAAVDDLCGGYGQVVESDESNNDLTGATIDVLASTAQIDLTIDDVIGPNRAQRGEALRLDVYLTNLGPDAAPGLSATACGFYVSAYLSTDTTIDTSDTLIGRGCMASLAGGATLRFFKDVTVPADMPRGFYYWGAIADDTEILGETDETNNAFGSPDRVNITGR